MALHDPIEDALNERKKKARLIEAGAAIGSPNEESLDITRRFLAGNRQLPNQAASIARSRAFGQRGVQQRRAPLVDATPRSGSLSEGFFNLPGPVGFAKTPQGQAILQRILGRFKAPRRGR